MSRCRFSRQIFKLSSCALLATSAGSSKHLHLCAAENAKNPVATFSTNLFKHDKIAGSATLLCHEADRYKGVIIDSNQLPDTTAEFQSKLRSSIDIWKSQDKKGVWLKIPAARAALIAEAIDQGFEFHHAEKEYVMMNTWLSTEHENRLPGNCTHQAGVGCIIMRDDGKLVLVQEKNGPLKGSGVWKMPTGLVDPGEDIADAAVREAREETGIETEFEQLLCFRQAHNVAFGKSDLFFVCVLKLKGKSSELRAQPEEISACDWMDLDFYVNQPFFQASELHRQINELLIDYRNVHIYHTNKVAEDGHRKHLNKQRRHGMVHSKLTTGFRPGKQSLYHFPSSSTSSSSSTSNPTSSTGTSSSVIANGSTA